MTAARRAIVAGHGTFAPGLISAVEQITGRGDCFVPVTNAGLCLDDIQGLLAKTLDDTGAGVIFTDLPAGSCTMAVRRMLRERPGVLLVTGVSLPLLLDFAMQEDAVAAVAMLATTVERARGAMTVHGG